MSKTRDTSSGIGGRGLVLIAAVMWSTSGAFAAWLPGFRGETLAFWRALFAGAALLPFVRRPSWSWRLVPLALIFTAMNYTFLRSLVEATHPACAIWMQHTSPAWVVVIGRLVFHERMRLGDALMLALALAGVAVILSFELRGQSPHGVLLGLLSGLTYAGVVLTLRQLRDLDSLWLVTLSHLAAAAALSPFALRAAAPSGWEWAVLAGFGALQMGLPYVLFARGLQSISSIEASGIVLLEPILLPVWVFLIRGDWPAWWILAGAGLILSGLVAQLAVGE